ncbi:N-6 DNA methylase [Pseudofrankia sp. DC12]|uniref:N-6 DNA methylase n=1 Tax=Pseudofrankia sp. DC12 TaxID=683315 RepID=UPI0005F87092|nr:N-6 DNA methylase [Pseudofrankia sp. DC12]
MVDHVDFDGQEELTAAAVARRVGVGRAAVSNWRRRYDDFPQPVGGGPSTPTFRWADVATWLENSGRAEQLAKAGRTETGTEALDGPTGGWTVRSGVAEQAVTSRESGDLLARVVVSLLPASVTAGVASGNGPFPPSDDLPAVLDSACAQGTLLLAVADRFDNRVRLLGQELDEGLAQSATLNLRGHPLTGPYDIRLGDSLRGNRFTELLGRAAAVVCEPPFDRPDWPADELTLDRRWEFGIPAPRDGELAWVQHCYAHLRPRGIAIVAVSPRTCVSPSGQAIREAMVRSGALRAVIALPPKMSSSGVDAYLWVLRRQHGESDGHPIVMIDLSAVPDMAEVPQQFAVWQRLYELAAASPVGAGRHRPGPSVARSVSRLRLLDGETNLLPSRYVTTRAEPSADDLARLTGQVEALYRRIGSGLPRYGAAGGGAGFSFVTLAELERAGALTIRQRGTEPRAGDVLVWPRTPSVVVASGGESIAAMASHVIELDPARLDPAFVTMFLRPEVDAVPIHKVLGVLGREDLRRCRIPRLAIDGQRRFGAEFGRLSELRDTLATLARLSATMIDHTLHGLTAGILTPDRLTARPTPTPEENL